MITAIDRMTVTIAAVFARAFSFRAAMDAPEWAESIRRMDGGRHYRFSYAPYQREMMEAPFDPEVQLTAFQMASRLGKTEVVMNIAGHSIDEHPRRILVLYPTNSQAEKWSKETLEKELFESTPTLQYLVRGGRRNSSNTILHKIFPGGLINIFGGNSPGEMRRAKGNLLFADEIDALQEIEGDEGDQLEIFWMRASEYPDAIKIAASYPSTKGRSRIDALMQKSDYRRWYTPCAKCGEPFVMLRSQIKYPAGEPEKAEIEAPCCGKMLTDGDRRSMVAAGEWRATRPFNGIRGFWGNGMLSPHPAQKGFVSHLHWIASQEIKAESAENRDRALRVIVNTFDAEPHEPEAIDAPEAHALLKRREDWDGREELPQGVKIIKAGVDIQKTWKEISVWGFGANKEKWLVDHAKLDGAHNDPGSWDRLLEWITGRKYKQGKSHLTLAGSPAKPCVFVDSSHWGDIVMEWTRKLRNIGIYAVQGSPTVNAPVVGKRRLNAMPKAWVYPLGVNQAKENIYAWLTIPKPKGDEIPAGYIHFPKWVDEVYLSGLTAEVGREERFRGEVFTRYECPKGKRNEPLDTFVYAYAAMVASRVNLDGNPSKEQPAEISSPWSIKL